MLTSDWRNGRRLLAAFYFVRQKKKAARGSAAVKRGHQSAPLGLVNFGSLAKFVGQLLPVGVPHDKAGF
jgi:hypothetical protein